MYDEPFVAAAREWMDEAIAWDNGTHPEAQDNKDDCPFFWQYSSPPDPDYYRTQDWTPGEATCYQIYETVSEGTPTSPVFETEDEMTDWLIGKGYSATAARRFVAVGSVPSLMIHDGVFYGDVEAALFYGADEKP